jgi:hypothetical protein
MTSAPNHNCVSESVVMGHVCRPIERQVDPLAKYRKTELLDRYAAATQTGLT